MKGQKVIQGKNENIRSRVEDLHNVTLMYNHKQILQRVILQHLIMFKEYNYL